MSKKNKKIKNATNIVALSRVSAGFMKHRLDARGNKRSVLRSKAIAEQTN